MIKRLYSNYNVVEAAKIRIKNCFSTANKIQFNISGGKDSIVLNDIVYKLCASGEVDKNKLRVVFIDEEAIYPDVEKIVMQIRKQWLLLGVEFRWYCVQVRHFSCFNKLTQEESFICWDKNRKDCWIRPMPTFAQKSDPYLRERVDTYQAFFDRIRAKERLVRITGVRASESVQRLKYLSKMVDDTKVYPIYDFKDTDIWIYIKENNLNFPKTYLYMYQTGSSKREMRISQFFSVDTAKSLVKMCEYYPGLFDRICKREPNAYMAMLYYDTELYRHQKVKNGSDDYNVDYESKFWRLIKNPTYFETKSAKKLQKELIKLSLKFSPDYYTQRIWKDLCNIITGGDPKLRSIRAVTANIAKEKVKTGAKENGETKNG